LRGNYPLAAKLYRDQAEKGDADAELALASEYMSGHGVERNPDEAAKWLLRAADGGNSAAQSYAAEFYEKGRDGFKQDYGQALKWYQQMADRGDLRGLQHVALYYKNGWAVPKKELAQRGDGPSQAALVDIYLARRTLESYQEAYFWGVLDQQVEVSDSDIQLLPSVDTRKLMAIETYLSAEQKETTAKRVLAWEDATCKKASSTKTRDF
jgi:TPR repeat protein